MSTVSYGITNTADDLTFIPDYGLLDTNPVNGGSAGTPYAVGIRFLGVAIPQGATISAATLALKKDVANSTAGSWGVIKGVAADNAPAWTTVDPIAAPKTAQSVTIVDGATQTYDVADIVQAIVSDPAWSAGNAMAFAGDPSGATGLMAWVDFSTSPTDCAQLSITYTTGGAPAPTLGPLTLDKTTVHANAPVGYVAANVLGKTEGSVLALANSADDFFVLDGTQVKISGPITAPIGGYAYLDMVETLAGAVNSPFEVSPTLQITPPRIAEFVGQAIGTTTATMPAHQAGDWIFCLSVRDGSTTPPAAPTGQNWSEANSGGANTIASRLNYKVARNSSEVVGTFSNTTTVIVLVYRPAAGYTLSLGAVVAQQGATANITYPGLTLQDTSGTSMVLAFGAHRSTNTTLETPPAGMVLRSTAADATDEAAAFDTNGGVSSWSAKTFATGGSTAGWRTISVELKGTATGGISYRRRSVWISLID